MEKNLPVPTFEPAPINLRWVWNIAPPAFITWLYRRIPAPIRAHWNPAYTPNSHLALAAILAGGGWTAFGQHARFQIKDGIPWWMDGSDH